MNAFAEFVIEALIWITCIAAMTYSVYLFNVSWVWQAMIGIATGLSVAIISPHIMRKIKELQK